MKLRHLLWVFPFASVLSAQEAYLSASSTFWKGLEVRFVSKVELAGTDMGRLPGAVVPESDRAHRVISDNAHQLKVGYDLFLEPSADGQNARLRIAPLNQPGSQSPAGVEPGWTMVGPAKFPVLPVMHAGDTVAIELMVNPATGQKLVDYLTLRQRGAELATAAIEPHDFAVTDVDLKLDSPHVWLNGKLLDSTATSSGTIVAHSLWLYVPGSGSFHFSLWPEPALGFQKSGTASGNTLAFRDGPAEYRVECSSSIAPGSGPFNLYVLHDPVWHPGGGNGNPPDSFIFGGADRAEYLVHKR